MVGYSKTNANLTTFFMAKNNIFILIGRNPLLIQIISRSAPAFGETKHTHLTALNQTPLCN